MGDDDLIGSSLGPYRVDSKLGEGGMGVVWRATEERLGREVAIKLLPDAVASDGDRMARFQREAQVLASLSHPNVAALHTIDEVDGRHLLVMELVEGEELGEILQRGPLPLDEALRIADGIAAGVAAAHDAGIVHRDLKPGNVRITPEGEVKVLDFGLARPGGDADSTSDLSLTNSPTFALDQGTLPGMILGTAAYMSPEQARGQRVDHRADVWAFGVVLWEMLTGSQLVHGDTVSDVLAGVLRAELDFDALPAATPPAIHRLLHRCLERDPKRRLHSLHDARLELQTDDATPAPRPEARRSPPAVVALVAIVAGLAGLMAGWLGQRGEDSPEPPQARVFALETPELQIPGFRFAPQLAVASDGGLAAVGASGAILYKPPDAADWIELEGAEGFYPFFAPDGSAIGYFSNDRIHRVEVADGQHTELGGEIGLWSIGAAWGDDGWIYACSYRTVARLPERGGKPEYLELRDGAPRWVTDMPLDLDQWIQSPDWVASLGRIVFTYRQSGAAASGSSGTVYALDPESLELDELAKGYGMVRWSPTGHLVGVTQDRQVVAWPVDPESLAAVGKPVRVYFGAEPFPFNNLGYHFDIGGDGSLLIAPEQPLPSDRLAWVDLQGGTEVLADLDTRVRQPVFSPDGRHLAFTLERREGTLSEYNLWSLEIGRGVTRQLTFITRATNPTWSPDGQRVLFTQPATETDIDEGGIFDVPLVGGATPRRLTRGQFQWIQAIARDGTLAITTNVGHDEGWDVALIRPDSSEPPRPWLDPPAGRGGLQLSPDEQWMAYRSRESGRSEVYLSAFPEPRGAIQVSANGGTDPRWSPDGKTLYYRDGHQVLAVDLGADGPPSLGTPRLLFEHAGDSWDLHPDGQRFVFTERVTTPVATRLDLHLDWADRLEELAPHPR